MGFNSVNPDTYREVSLLSPDTELKNTDFLPKKGENAVQFWQRQNKEDNAIGLYCQNCCYRYPEICIFIKELHPYDTFAEVCPDFVPKDMYKGKSKAKCWKKRLQVEPDYSPLPDNLVFHPMYSPFVICDSTQYFMIMTKEKAYGFLKRELKKND